MFSSLRSRLWLSYALLVFIALTVVAAILVIYLVRNPTTTRQVLARLRADQAVILNDRAALTSLDAAGLQAKSEQYDRTFDIRVIVINRSRQVLADSQAATSPGLQLNPGRVYILNPTAQDVSGRAWLVSLSRISNNRVLVLATPRPPVALLGFLADEMVPVLSVAGLAALLLSLLLAILLARWITHPLQDVISAARSVPAGQARPLKPHGPREVQDLTRNFNEMAARVQASQKSQREFVANVSHELKTPLTSIQGFAQAILDGTAESPEARQQAAGVIHAEAGRMHRLVLDLLDLARLDAGTADLQYSSVNLPGLLNNIAEKFGPLARAAGVDIQVEPASLPPVTGDGDRLAQVFTNLVDNALKFTPGGGSITLKPALDGNEIRVDVADTGSGIPAASLPHIFDRFYQADASRPGGQKHGAGLGLAIAREIVQAHGGTISVRSTPGQGSIFSVHLPLARPDATTIIHRKK